MDGEDLTTDGENIKTNGDLGSLVYEIVRSANVKIAVLLFVILVFVNTTVFIDRILNKWPGTTDSGQLTERGVIIQSMLICLVYIILDMLISHKYI